MFKEKLRFCLSAIRPHIPNSSAQCAQWRCTRGPEAICLHTVDANQHQGEKRQHAQLCTEHRWLRVNLAQW